MRTCDYPTGCNLAAARVYQDDETLVDTYLCQNHSCSEDKYTEGWHDFCGECERLVDHDTCYCGNPRTYHDVNFTEIIHFRAIGCVCGL